MDGDSDMTTLNVTDIVYQRGEGGALIPKEIVLESLPDKPTVKVIPLTRGKLQEVHALATSKDIHDKIKSDNEVIKCGLIEPKLTDEQLHDLKPQYANAITIAIMSVTLGIGQHEVTEKAEKIVNDIESELKKK